MAMTNALFYGSEKSFSRLYFYQMPKQTISSPEIIFNLQDFDYLPSTHSKKSPNYPVTTQEQLILISTFFGLSKSKLGEILGVTRQSIYNWLDNAEVANEHYEKIKRLADVAFEVDPEPSQEIFHVYANEVIDSYKKSLFDYLLDDNFDKDIVVKLSKTIYEMSKERWKRIDAMPKAKYRPSEPFV